MARTLIVVPCFNETRRLPVDRILSFLRCEPEVLLLLVNDGSTDETLRVLRRLEKAAPQAIGVCDLPRNQGKAEAVRRGCLAAFAQGADFVGYWDADLATPLEVLPDFLRVFHDRPELELVCGARVRLLGRSIRRTALRHYFGRVFATAASWTLGLGVYDTQCGAKLFRTSSRMREVFARPFTSRWLFDVEILARLIVASRAGSSPPVEQIVYELPLRQWRDVPGSKVKPGDFPKALLGLTGIYWRYLRPGAPSRQEGPGPGRACPARFPLETTDLRRAA